LFNHELFKKLRAEHRVTFRKIAEYTGMTAPYISHIEKGHVKNPSYAVVEAIAQIFGIDPKDFMTSDGDDDEKKKPLVDIMMIRKLREDRRMSVREAADKMGLNPATVSLIENGKRRAVSMTTLGKIADLYGVDTNDLLLQREAYVDLTALVLSSDTVIIDGEEIDVSDSSVADRILTGLKMAAAWAAREMKG
jgi:transcriptional regulator with XRE-family HTH domain